MGVHVRHTTPAGERVEIDSDVLNLDRKVKEGDAASGWRGDPQMWLCYTPQTKELEVWGLDAAGVPYIAAVEPASNPNWRFDILVRLRQGDWQRGGDVIGDLLAARDAKRAAADRAAEAEWDERAERLAWAVKKDMTGESLYGHFVPGRTTKEARDGGVH